MNSTARRIFAIGFALVLTAGCNAAPGRDRLIKTHSEPDGRRHPETFDVNANGTVTCSQAQNRDNDGGCYVRNTDGVPQNLKPGESMTVAGAGKVTFACTGSDAIYCAVDVKD